MAFSQTNITNPRATVDDVSLLVEWDTTEPAGTVFQVYVDHLLTYSGTQTKVYLPYPAVGDTVNIDVGAVGAGESSTNFADSLPAVPGGGRYVNLEWEGGRWQGEDTAGFRVYQGAPPSGTIDYVNSVAEVPVDAAGIRTDPGFGSGWFGSGEFGDSGNIYHYMVGPLASGTWNFAIKPFDLAGNEGTAATDSAVIVAEPAPPAANASGSRLSYTYNGTTHKVTLTWLASPG
jgi:hypothetical protein